MSTQLLQTYFENIITVNQHAVRMQLFRLKLKLVSPEFERLK